MQTNISVSNAIIDWVIGQNKQETISNNILELLRMWKSGEKQATFKQIERVSKSTHIPLGYFFLNTVPNEDLSFVEYRTVDSKELINPSRNLIDTMHNMVSVQSWLKDELDANNYDDLLYIGKIQEGIDVNSFASYIRGILKLEITWYEQRKTPEDCFNFLRSCISSVGTTVMMNGIVGNNTKRSLDVNEFRAFALVDRKAPLIFINAKDSMHGRVFSLLHEFAHLCLGTNSLFNLGNNNHFDVSKLETLCNSVAAEILVPKETFIEYWNNGNENQKESKIIGLSKLYKCSYIVIARRAYDMHYIDLDTYRLFVEDLSKRFERNDRKRGGNFYKTAISRIDKRFFSALIGSIAEGRTQYTEAFKLTNTNLKTFNNLINKMGGIE